MVFFSRDNICRIKDGASVINLDDKQRKGTHYIEFHYLLTEIQLFTLILSELNVFHKMS